MATIPASKTAGEELAATEVNKLRDIGYVVDLDAGETINGATLPVAIYIDDTTNEVYACDGNDQAKLEFIGFAISNSTDGNPIQIQRNGIVAGFTGLDIGKKYYVQDDQTIGTSIGTYEVLVGVAISATQILIMMGDFEYMGSVSITTNDDSVIPDGARFAIIKASYSGTSVSGAGVITIAKKGIVTGTLREYSYMVSCSTTYTWGAGVITNTVAASESPAQSATAYFYR